MKKTLLAFTLLMVSISHATAATADTLKGGEIMCLSKDLYDEIMLAVVKKDETAFDHLLKLGCAFSKAGVKFSLLEVTWTGAVRIRIYTGDTSLIVWTSPANVAKD